MSLAASEWCKNEITRQQDDKELIKWRNKDLQKKQKQNFRATAEKRAENHLHHCKLVFILCCIRFSHCPIRIVSPSQMPHSENGSALLWRHLWYLNRKLLTNTRKPYGKMLTKKGKKILLNARGQRFSASQFQLNGYLNDEADPSRNATPINLPIIQLNFDHGSRSHSRTNKTRGKHKEKLRQSECVTDPKLV